MKNKDKDAIVWAAAYGAAFARACDSEHYSLDHLLEVAPGAYYMAERAEVIAAAAVRALHELVEANS